MKLPFLKGRLARKGWEYRDSFPHHLPQYVLIAGPHTSWRDFFVALCIREDLGLYDLKILAKHSLFGGPWGASSGPWGRYLSTAPAAMG